MVRTESPHHFRPWAFWLLCGYLVLVFLTGGGSRGDIQSLAVLRPVSVLLTGIGLWGLTREQVSNYRFLFGLIAASFLLAGLQLIPLPPALWGALPGRDILTQVDRVAALGSVWRPISMVPTGTWNAFYSMFVPLATLVLAVQIGADQRQMLLRLFLIIGLASGVLGILQVVGPTDGPLYTYSVTNNGSAVGLFSNRNHQAMFLATMFPMLAVFASSGVRTIEQSRMRMGLSAIAGIVLIPLLLVTGSRGGVIAGLIGLLSLPALYAAPRFERSAKRGAISKPVVYASGIFAIIGLSLLTILFARAQAFERLLSSGTGDEERLIAWGPVAHMAWKYAPVGSGFGSFVEVYQIDEAIGSLSTSYFNHAHNDVLEIALEGGALGLLLLLLAYFGWAKAAWSAWRSPSKQKSGVSFARLGSIILLILALGSLADYPLRVPSLACFAMIAACWLADAKRQHPQN